MSHAKNPRNRDRGRAGRANKSKEPDPFRHLRGDKERSRQDAGAPRGRPSDFRPEYIEIAGRLALLGLTDVEIAGALGTSEPTLNKWKRDHPQFAEELKHGKQVPDSNVAASLYARAIGYEHKSVKIFNAGGAPLVVPFTEHFAPDVTACIFWLKNRQPRLWRDAVDHKHSGEVAGLPDDVLKVMRRLAAEKSKGPGPKSHGGKA